MSFRTTYILFGILGVMVLAFGVALLVAPTGSRDMTWLFPSAHDSTHPIDVKNVMRVELVRVEDDAHFVFSRDDKDQPFVMEKPAGFRVNDSVVSQLVNQVLDAKPVKYSDVRGKLAEYGLEKPLGHVTLT